MLDDRKTLDTRWSLITRLKDLEDQAGWQEFFDIYWRLIYNVASKAGLSDVEAQEVVQETVIAVSKRIQGFKTDPNAGSFKGWLLTLTRWKIGEQHKKVRRHQQRREPQPLEDPRRTAVIERIADDRTGDLESIWNAEWARNLTEIALHRIKNHVKPKHYQIFHLLMIEELGASEVATTMRVNIGQVYLIKYRLTRLLKTEIQGMEQQ